MKLDTWTVGKGPRTAVLVHGASKAADVWRDFARILVDEYDLTVMLLDQRGHGRSPRTSSYQMSDFADDLVDTLPTGLDLVIGHSLGGVAGAWASARLKPKRFIALDPGFSLPLAVTLVPMIMGALGPFRNRVLDWSLNLPAAIPPGAAPDTRERVRVMSKNWDMSMIGPLVRSARRRPFPVAAPAVPSTLVVIENSVVVPEKMSEGLRAAGWDVRLMPGVMHDMQLQDPRGLATLMDDLLLDKDRITQQLGQVWKE